VNQVDLMSCRFIGVSDLASIRFSLPAHLLEPTPNLGNLQCKSIHNWTVAVFTDCLVPEYWNYLDRPEAFISIGDSEDQLGRMLNVLRFWFTKDLVGLRFMAVAV
jgi:hypothetical protein